MMFNMVAKEVQNVPNFAACDAHGVDEGMTVLRHQKVIGSDVRHDGKVAQNHGNENDKYTFLKPSIGTQCNPKC